MSKRYARTGDVSISHTGYEDALKRASSKFNLDGSESLVVEERDGDGFVDFKPSEHYSRFDARFLNRDARYPDYEFDWAVKHRRIIDKVFFNEEAFIVKGTDEYHDCWKFVENFLCFQKKRSQQPDAKENKNNRTARISQRIRITEDGRHAYDLYREGDDLKDHRLRCTAFRLHQFQRLQLYYNDFVQKQKLSKLVKIQKDQKELPIYKYKEEIVDLLKRNSVIVIAGDTGCGKSTQVPQYLLEAGFAKIACTQPRRIAAISLAKRVGYETLNEYGSDVAYQVRFKRTKTAKTKILFLTEGLLLKQMSHDQTLSMYDIIVIDEVHERHIHTDYLLGILKCLLMQRQSVKLVLMSATINYELFSQYFNNAAILKIPGRQYPISLNYSPINKNASFSGKTSRLDPAPYIRILELIDNKYAKGDRGDVLVFLSGIAEIQSVEDAAREYADKTKQWIILPLHSSLSMPEQNKVFDISPSGVRKCILATNIAETSITVDGIRFVIDSGKVKEMSFDSEYQISKLKEFWISQASSEQRKGRAGRTGPGVCYRLYSQQDYDELQPYTTPEIHRVPLDSLILQMISMGLSDPRKFPYLEPPEPNVIDNSICYLQDQGAITTLTDSEGLSTRLTPIGTMLSELPVDIVVGKMLIQGSCFLCIQPLMTIAASLSIRTPFGNTQRNPEALTARKSLESHHGDLITLFNAYNAWLEVKRDSSTGATNKWCKRRLIEQYKLYECAKLRKQFQQLLSDHGLSESIEEDESQQTSADRKLLYSQRRQLNKLRHQQRNSERKRKVLKLQDNLDFTAALSNDDVSSDSDNGDDVDQTITDLEFRLTNDLKSIDDSDDSSLFQLHLIKVIITSGLFPQVAIADEHNVHKSDAERVFHTKRKMFLLLHPCSVFSERSDYLTQAVDESINSKQVKGAKVHKGHSVLSGLHQLIAYVSLLETTKPYLVGLMRIPALQSCLLFASSIDTNEDCTRIIADEWLEFYIPNTDMAALIVEQALFLRFKWKTLLELKLSSMTAKGEEDSEDKARRKHLRKIRHLSKNLSKSLSDFVQTYEVLYSIRRMMAAELKTLYVRSSNNSSTDTSSTDGARTDSTDTNVKGGEKINEYLTINCLAKDHRSQWNDYVPSSEKEWYKCTRCKHGDHMTVCERLQHAYMCIQRGRLVEEEDDKDKEIRCPACDDILESDRTRDLLRHKVTCRGKKIEKE